MNRSVATAALAAMACLPLDAPAHVSLAQLQAPAGAAYVAAFRVSHACGDSPTVSLRIEIPAAIAGVNPQPKPDWTVTVERAPVADGSAGKGRITAILWQGRLDADFFDEFTALLKLPDAAGPIYFPTHQVCASGDDRRWEQIPAPGRAWTSVPRPAPVLHVLPANATPAASAESHANH